MLKNRLIVLASSGLLTVMAGACGETGAGNSPSGSADRPIAATPSEAGARPLTALDELEGEAQNAARAAIDELERQQEDPAEFYVSVSNEGEKTTLHLLHESAFAPENRGVVGNPGGKCRDMVYDRRTGKIVQTLFWQ